MHKHPKHFQLGRVLRSHGLAGDVVCLLDTDHPEYYAKQKAFFLEINHSLLPYFIKKVNLKGADAIISFEGITTSEQASKLKGSEIYLPLEALRKPSKNEFYLHDVIGCTLIDDQLGELGVIESLIEATGNNLLTLTYQGSEVLVPLVKEFVYDIDIEHKTLKSRLPEGLLELYLEKKVEKDDAFDEEDED